jgi:acetate kinase
MLGIFNKIKHAPGYILAVNAGSSSVKAVVYETCEQIRAICQCTIENIGQTDVVFKTKSSTNIDESSKLLEVKNHTDAIATIINWLNQQLNTNEIVAVGHRIVHGGPQYFKPQLITDKVVEDWRAFSSYDPDHLPNSIQLIKKLNSLFPNLPQVACFDTAFSHDLPRVAQILPIPRKYEKEGLRRYGFHGLSYTYLLSKLRETDGDQTANGRIILAHLGSGSSLTATLNGKPLDTTMGLTPASGIPMSTRSGDLDPGIAWYLHHKDGLGIAEFNDMVNRLSGLLGVSETSADMKTLLQHEETDVRAAEAVDLFCYQTKKAIGSLAAVLGGVDMVVFSGGIGEKAPLIRSRICEGLGFLGLELDEDDNNSNASEISAHGSRVRVRIMHTDEERIIAEQVAEVVNISSNK